MNFDELVLDAYNNKNSSAHKLIKKYRQNLYRIYTEIDFNECKKFSDCMYASQVILFNNNFKQHLGIAPVFFRDVKINSYSDSVHESQTYLSEFDDEFMMFFLYEKLIQKNSICVDIGANVGLHSCVLSKLCPEGKVMSFEPSDSCILRLKENVEINNVKNIELIKEVLFSEKKQVNFNFNKDNFNKGVGSITNDRNNTSVIVSSTLDDIVGNTKIDLIKIDVEGSELEVLKGGIKSIKNNKPHIIIEYNSESWNLSDLFDVIPYEFSLHRIPNYFDEKMISVKTDLELKNRFTNLYIKPKLK